MSDFRPAPGLEPGFYPEAGPWIHDPGDDRTRLADFVAREAVRLNTSPMPRFAKPQRAPYEAPEGWRSWGDFARYGEAPDGR